MYEICCSLGTDNQREEIFAACQKAGISRVEISCSDLTQAEAIDFKKLKEYSDIYGVKLWSHHLPFWPFNEIDISSSNEELRKKSVELCTKYIKRAGEVGIDKFVIHPSGEPITEEERPFRITAAKNSLKELAEVAADFGGVIAVEDLPRTCLGRESADISELISADERLRVCFDTNHLLKEEIRDFIRSVGEKIITTHVSDYDRVNERHWLPGEGVIDWQELLTELKKVNYTGVWLYEIGLKCPDSIIRDRDLTFDDFVRNAQELFKGENPTIFSKPVEKLGFWGPEN